MRGGRESNWKGEREEKVALNFVFMTPSPALPPSLAAAIWEIN